MVFRSFILKKFYLSIYNEYSAKLQKAISGRGKNIMAPFEDSQKIQDYSTNTSTSKKITHFEYIV